MPLNFQNLVFACALSAASAIDVQSEQLDRLARQSDVVLVGKVTSTSHHTDVDHEIGSGIFDFYAITFDIINSSFIEDNDGPSRCGKLPSTATTTMWRAASDNAGEKDSAAADYVYSFIPSKGDVVNFFVRCRIENSAVQFTVIPPDGAVLINSGESACHSRAHCLLKFFGGLLTISGLSVALLIFFTPFLAAGLAILKRRSQRDSMV